MNSSDENSQDDIEDLEDLDIEDRDYDLDGEKSKKRSTKLKKTAVVKKKPGRPPKNPKNVPVPKKGIALTPTSPEYCVEFLYDKPLFFKKIFQFFKSMSSQNIQILFRPTDIIFYSKDHHGVSKIFIKIDGTKINYYYCKQVLDVGISVKDIEGILKKVNKEFTSISLVSTADSLQRSITMILENSMQTTEFHNIELIGQYNKMEDENAYKDIDYTINFQYSSKYFRSIIDEIHKLSKQISIIKNDDKPYIILDYVTTNKKTNSSYMIRNSDQINLVSKLAEGDIFRVDVNIDYINPISKAQVSDIIELFVDERKPFTTRSFIDEGTIELKTMTDIIDNRPKEINTSYI